MTVQAFSFTKIEVKDIAAAQAFYTAALGLEVVGRVNFGEGERLMHEVILALPGSRPPAPNLIIISYPNATCPTPGEATTGFMVADLDAALARATAAGATIDIPATDVPEHGLRLAFILDPLGHRIELLQQISA
jgi:catechol 2,3-dioxygenase-like lactoylglutathione lyase family enzyme